MIALVRMCKPDEALSFDEVLRLQEKV